MPGDVMDHHVWQDIPYAALLDEELAFVTLRPDNFLGFADLTVVKPSPIVRELVARLDLLKSGNDLRIRFSLSLDTVAEPADRSICELTVDDVVVVRFCGQIRNVHMLSLDESQSRVNDIARSA